MQKEIFLNSYCKTDFLVIHPSFIYYLLTIIHNLYLFGLDRDDVSVMIRRYNQQQFMQQAQERLRLRQVEVLAKTSIQHLYQLLGKNAIAENGTSLSISIDKKFQLYHPDEGIKGSLDYSRVPNEARDESPSRKTSILQGFHQKTRLQCSQKKKAFSVECSNNKLKEIIFGKKDEKKMNFFDGVQTEPRRNINYPKIDPSNELPREPLKRSQTDCDQKAHVVNDIDLTYHFQRFKEQLKLKPIEYYVKKSKNSKFSIMGLSMKKYKKVKGKEHTENKATEMSDLQLSIVKNGSNQESQMISQWKIDSLQLKIGENKPNKSNLAKIKKKTSIQTLASKCLPYLMISEHILWKIQEMMKFYSIVLLSFQCLPHIANPNDLPKYHRKHVKLTYFVGSGNNRTLIADLMQKRWWWKQTSDINEADFIWTQQKLKLQQSKAHLPAKQPIISPDKMPKQNTQKLKKQFRLSQNDPKCKNLLQSFEANQKQIFDSSFRNLEQPLLLCNHMSGAKYLGNKKSLFLMLKTWFQIYKQRPQDVFSFIPQTYHIENVGCQGYKSFQKVWNSQKDQNNDNLWIIKPGENSNRGRGIFLTSQLKEITETIENRQANGGTTIIQRYFSDLLLYNGRKFDIRTYLLCITVVERTRFYWYDQGYLRTSSHPFSLKELSSMTHLTNDAIQSQGQQYGKYEKGNKLSYSHFQTYLQENSYRWKVNDLRKSMKRIAKTIASVSFPVINSTNQTSFQLFGLDFLVDSSFKPWLLEVNTNPCLETSSPLLQKLIPNMVENVLRLSVDPIFPPTVLPNKESEYTLPDKMMEWNKFQLVFDSRTEGEQEWKAILSRTWNTSKQSKDFGHETQ